MLEAKHENLYPAGHEQAFIRYLLTQGSGMMLPEAVCCCTDQCDTGSDAN